MNILVLGGTRFFGVHLVKKLIGEGHAVSIATRGQAADSFGSAVTRYIIERTDAQSIKKSLGGKKFDVIYDNVCYSSNEVKALLDNVNTKRYILTSTLSVYENLHDNISESDFNPLEHKLKWCSLKDFDYGEVKRQAEAALFQQYANIPAAAVRFPFVIGIDDYTKRLLFYVEHIAKGMPMNIDNLDEKLAFVRSDEAGEFLAFLCKNDITGPVNGASTGQIAIGEIVSYVEKLCGKKAVLSPDGAAAPYNSCPSYSMDNSKAANAGFEFSCLNNWIFDLLKSMAQHHFNT